MLSIQIAQTGGPEVLQLVERPAPTLDEGQILVRNHAIGLNFIDIYRRSGLYPLPLPTGLGDEGAGIVEAVGAGVTRFKPGDRVAYAAAPVGAYAQLHAVPQVRAVILPDAISFEVAAACLLKGLTANALLTQCAHVGPGDIILVHAAAGGVGQILSQWAKALGATVIGTVGTKPKAAQALARGCDHVILYAEEDVPARVRELTEGRGVKVVYDSVGKATIEGSLDSLARRGTLVTYGNASGPPPPIDPMRLMRGGSLTLIRPTVGDYVSTAEEFQAGAAALFAAIADGRIVIEIGQTWRLADAAQAHVAMASRSTQGSSVLIP